MYLKTKISLRPNLLFLGLWPHLYIQLRKECSLSVRRQLASTKMLCSDEFTLLKEWPAFAPAPGS